MDTRFGESGHSYRRSNRFYQIQQQWFFDTREKLHIGPYENLDLAEIAFVLCLRHLTEGGVATQAYRELAHI